MVQLFAALAVMAAIVPSADGAVPAEAPSELVYSNGGRIVATDADGGGRHLLFASSRVPKNDQLGAVEPHFSRDGAKLAVAFRRNSGYDVVNDIWLAAGDGSGGARILPSKKDVIYGDPTFAPDGSLYVAFFRESRNRAVAGLAQVADDGAIERTIPMFKQKRKRFQDWTHVRDPEFSPDGTKILYTTSEYSWTDAFDDGYASKLWVLNRATGKSRLVSEQAQEGAWSPDGSRIVYTALDFDEEIEVCWLDAICDDGGRLMIVAANGKGGRKVVSTPGDQRSPDWSANGRIVFQSASNIPNEGEAYEIYSVRPDGGCLTMLSNGAPASVSPSWNDAEAAGSPQRCGGGAPEVVLDLRPPRPKGALEEMFWAGLKAGTRLMTSFGYEDGLAYLTYVDCDQQKPAACGRPFYMYSANLCSIKGDLAGFMSERPARRQRGLPVFRFGDAEMGPITYVMTGRFAVLVVGGSRGGVREVAALRALEEESSAGDLPAPVFPASDIARMKKVETAFASAGSVAKTARRLGIGRRAVRQNLRLARRIAEFGDYGTMRCGPTKRTAALRALASL
ncbi:MAG: PD40 domain-containing protein [Solirubrobacterales bacterium]|nr:PD40 domain-containing protein [Solirubrobacterales bacterium]